MSEKIRVLGKEYNVSNEKQIKETIKKLRKELRKQKKLSGGNDELTYSLEDSIIMLKDILKEYKKAEKQKEIIKEIAKKYNVSEDDLTVMVAEEIEQKHYFTSTKFKPMVERLAKELKED
jgi:hypothetical protein